MSTRPLTLLERADRLGRCRYVELLAFTRLGERAARAENGACATFLAGASKSHAYRAAEIESRLPVSVGLPSVAQCTHAPDYAIDDLLALIVEESDDAVVSGVLALYESMATAYLEHFDACSVFADPPVKRLLGRVLFDLNERVSEARALVGRDALSPNLREILDRPEAPFGSLL
jgi:hypothetical protein